VNVRKLRFTFLATFAALCAAFSSLAPGMAQAQTGPVVGSWIAGPDGAGPSTIVGRVEAPTRARTVNSGSNLQVTGWAADTTARGWAGVDGIEVWLGAKDKGGSKLVTGGPGSVGLARSDVSDALGSNFVNSGFNVVVPASAWSAVSPGAMTLYVYLHTPGKGTWYKTVNISLASTIGLNGATGTPLLFPTDPMIVIARPQEGMNITQKQKNNKFNFNGIALDRNPIVNPAIQTTGPGCSGCATATGNLAGPTGSGIANITAYIDTPPAKGDTSTFGNFGAPCTSCLYSVILVNNAGSINTAGKQQGSIIAQQFGSQFDFAGWTISINPATLTPGPHTLFVTATSAVTGTLDATGRFVGKQSTASVHFNILDLTHTQISPDPLTCSNKATPGAPIAFFC
jgi:hypothetical protein